MRSWTSRSVNRRPFATAVAVTAVVLATMTPRAQSVAVKDTTVMVQRALQRLPYYGVFDFLAFGVDRGTVTVTGYAYRGYKPGTLVTH